MENVKVWGVRKRGAELWRRSYNGDQPLWSLVKDNRVLAVEAETCGDYEIAEIPDDYSAMYSDISEAMIRRAKMLCWDRKLESDDQQLVSIYEEWKKDHSVARSYDEVRAILMKRGILN